MRVLRNSAIVVAVLAIVLLVVRSSIVRMYRMGAASMAPTLCVGDGVWVNLMAYDLRIPFTDWVALVTGDPEHGELVLCSLSGRKHHVVKRVLAVGGDTVAIVDDRLMINDIVVRQEVLDPEAFSRINEANHLGNLFAREFTADTSHIITYHSSGSPVPILRSITVPDDSYFLIGDNRGNSWDSRYPEFGCVPRSMILGRVIGEGREFGEPAE